MSLTVHRIRRWFGRALAFGLILMIASTVTLAILWQRGTLKHWLQARAVEFYIRQVQPHLPFQIEEADADATWRELLAGHISRMSTVIRWQNWRIRLSGPIEITRPARENVYYVVKFKPQATIEPVSSGEDRSSPVELDLYVKAPQEFTRLTELKVKAHAEDWQWKHFGVAAKSPKLVADWKDDQAHADVSWSSLHWNPSKDHTLDLSEASLTADAPLKLKPLVPPSEIQFRWRAKHAEALWGETYLDLPLSLLPVDGKVGLSHPSAPELAAEVGGIRIEASPTRVRWKTPALPIRELLQRVMTATGSASGPFAPLNKLRPFDIRGGTIQTEGVALLGPAHRGLPDVEGTLHLSDGAFQWKNAAIAARGVKVDVPFSTRHGAQAIVSATDVYYRKLHARLDPTDVSLEALGRDVTAPEGVAVRVGRGGRGEDAARIPLTIDGVPLELGAVTGKLAERDKPYDLRTSLKLAPVAIEALAHPLCLKNHDRMPPAKVEVNLASLSLAPGTIDPDGEVLIRLFDGKIRLGEMSAFDLDTEINEIDFDLDFDGIQLGQLGAWSGFGDMVGTLQGYAHEVVLHNGRPAHFDLSIDAIPLKSWIEFSPEAMKNLVGLFAGEGVDHIPGIAQEGFFGWVSHKLGGYDVKYAGLSLYAADGTVLMKTHDLPDIYRLMKKHYIFWGHRFKMPIESSQYPVVMDEVGMDRVIRVMAAQIHELAERKREKQKEEHHEDENENAPDCLPPGF